MRRYRANGPDGPGVYPQCVPVGDEHPHLLAWDEAPVHGDSAFASHAPVALTPSEIDVLRAAANGLTANESAVLLRKGAETVKTQRRQVILKFGARNIAHAIGMATEMGLVEVDA